MYHGHLPPCIDHKDCNGLNNSIHNLRPATVAQNGWNSSAEGKRKGVHNLPRGVSYKNDTVKKYRARISVNKVVYELGRYDTPEEAHQAYIEAAKKYHGDFARFD